jgi:sigma-B regulation protein RsbQ
LSALPDAPHFLIAESFSSAVALQTRLPASTRGIVLVGGFARTPSRVARVARHAPRLAVQAALSAYPERMINHMCLGANPSPAVAALLRTTLQNVSAAALVERLRLIGQFDERARLAELTLPVLYLAGVHDQLVPRACGEEIVGDAPNRELRLIHAPHLMLQAAPADCAAAVAQFVVSRVVG